MPDERRDFDRLPQEPHRTRWKDWLVRHGADPARAVVPGWIERRPERHQLAYSAYVPDDDGDPTLDEDDEIAVIEVVCQLDAPPEPFPDLGGDSA